MIQQTATGYEPLNTLKPVVDRIWRIDGPPLQRGWVPYPTRAVVVKLVGGALWVFSPTKLTDALSQELAELGPVAHIIAPNKDHQTHVAAWKNRFPNAKVWAPEGGYTPAQVLQPDRAEGAWQGQIEQCIVRTGPNRREAVFCHKPTRTLIFADLFEALETRHLPARARPVVWFSGTDDSSGNMRPSHRWALREKDKAALAEDVECLIRWNPRRILLSHGKCFDTNAVGQLERAFRKILRTHRWEAAFVEHTKNIR